MGDFFYEYLEVPLSDSMIGGKEYCVEFFVSMANINSFAIDKIGAHFSVNKIKYCDLNLGTLYLSEHISNNNGILTDTMNWVKISGVYTAVGGEKFMTIGNFFGIANTNYLQFNNSSYSSYYFIDDVSVYDCNSLVKDIFIPNVFSPNEDDINDLFRVENLPDNYQMEIYNRWGEIVYRIAVPGNADNNIFTWDGYTMSGIECPDGVYYYVLSLPDQDAKRGTVTILR